MNRLIFLADLQLKMSYKVFIGIILFLLVMYIISSIAKSIGLIIIAKRNNIPNAIFLAIFKPKYLLRKVGYQAYSNSNYFPFQVIILIITILSFIFIDKDSILSIVFPLMFFILFHLVTVISYVNILSSDKNGNKILYFILSFIGLGPLLLAIKSYKLPIGNKLDNSMHRVLNNNQNNNQNSNIN